MPQQSNEHEHLARVDRGLTLIELLISMTLTFIIGGVITAALITSMNAADSTARSAANSTDAQLIAAYLTRDAQAAGGTDPTTAANDPTLGVSTTDAAGCTQTGTLVVRFAWVDRRATPATGVVVTYARRTDGQLVRRACTATNPVEVILARNVTAASATCAPGGTCAGLPDSVTLAITGGASSTPFDYTLTASLRADPQTSPDSVNSASVPLVALRTGACPAVSLGGSAALHVRGDALVNGGCGATPIAGDLTLLKVSGTTYLPPSTNDPFASLAAPATCPASGSNPTIGSSSGPTAVTVYPVAVSITTNTVFQAGRHVFCNGLVIGAGATVTGSGVLWYVASGSVSISSTATVDMSPASTGAYRNLSLWSAATQSVAITGGDTVDSFAGVVYAPRAAVTASSSAGIRFAGLIADTITTGGTGPIRLGLPMPALSSFPGALPDGQLTISYSATAPVVNGGTAPYTYSATGLPAGLAISSGGSITGTPTQPGTFNVVIVAVDATGASLPINRTLFVSALPVGCPSSTTGWWGQYWTNNSLTGTATICRADPTLSFDWGTGTPDPSIPLDNFSARWTRAHDFAAGTYDFTAGSDDGLRLFIDGVKVIDRSGTRSLGYDTTR